MARFEIYDTEPNILVLNGVLYAPLNFHRHCKGKIGVLEMVRLDDVTQADIDQHRQTWLDMIRHPERDATDFGIADGVNELWLRNFDPDFAAFAAAHAEEVRRFEMWPTGEGESDESKQARTKE